MPQTGLGGLIGLGLGAYGKKPKVPTLKDISPDVVQKDTVAGNIASFADIAKLATSVNQFNQSELETALDRALGPGVRQQIQKNIAAQTRGEVPEDVSRAITRFQAGRGTALTAGSAFQGNAMARDLGLTSLQLIDRGLSAAESWLSRAAAPQMDVTSMFFTPQQRLGFQERQQALQFERDMIAAGVKAAPDPAMAALAQGFDNDIKTMSDAALSFGGMAAGGFGGFGGKTSGTSTLGGFGGLGSVGYVPNRLG